MKLSARNQLKGTVTAIHPGAVNAIVILELDGGQLVTSSISMGSLKDLDLQVGQTAYAIVKASNVIIGVDDYRRTASNMQRPPWDSTGAAVVSAWWRVAA